MPAAISNALRATSSALKPFCPINALAAAYDFKQRGDEVTLLFQGAGTRWVGELGKSEHLAVDGRMIADHRLGKLPDVRALGESQG